MPSCMSFSEFGGGFLQPIVDLPTSGLMNFGQIYQKVNILQSFNRLQGLKFKGAFELFGKLGESLTRLQALGFTTPILDNAQGLLTGLPAVGGFTNGLYGFIQEPNLTSLLTPQGSTFMTGMRDLLGTGYNANIQGINYVRDSLQFVSAALSSNADGIDILSTLQFPPTSAGGLRSVGFLTPLIDRYGDGVGIESSLRNAEILLRELRGHAFIFHSSFLSSNQDLLDFDAMIAEMHGEGLLLDETITGAQGAESMTNMLAILQTFAK